MLIYRFRYVHYITRQIMKLFSNRLTNEKSPYLLQHAHNPVDWFPWGDDAFEKARSENKPIFLSIGYSTCHWCHVMERESFEDPVIGKLLNDAFVCIKVDREERPDIDQIYMTVCQMMNGQGGWPLSIFLTPEQQPFHAATYIPPSQRYGRIGLTELVPRIAEMWQVEQSKLIESAEKITDHLISHQLLSDSECGEISGEHLKGYVVECLHHADREWGGFGKAPKFPNSHRLLFLMRFGNKQGLQVALHTLERMRLGGLYDQVGFGFHRYSTDRTWLVPHFEKMLYDQALLVMAYLEAFQRTDDPFFRMVVEEVLTYVMRDMRDAKGGFYTAEDADSEGEEGLFYLWRDDELRNIVGDSANWLTKLWSFETTGNFRDESTGQKTGRNIPFLKDRLTSDEQHCFDPLRNELFEAREKRIHPLKDKKILTDWNGLMIAAFASAGRVLNNSAFIKTAEEAANFILETLMGKGMRFHRWCDGEASFNATLEDHAYMIHGLLALFDATLKPVYLEEAIRLGDELETTFKDDEQGGYYMNDAASTLIIRPKEFYDGALPSGNSVQLDNLLRLARLTGDQKWQAAAARLSRVFEKLIPDHPLSYMQAVLSLQGVLDDPVELVVCGESHQPETINILSWLQSNRATNELLIHKTDSTTATWNRLAPHTKENRAIDGCPTVYICRSYRCMEPVHTLSDLKAVLSR